MTSVGRQPQFCSGIHVQAHAHAHAHALLLDKLGKEQIGTFDFKVSSCQVYAAEMKAWYESEGFKAFAAEVDEWEAQEKEGKVKSPLKSFRAWRRKKLQGKRQQQKLADRERAKAEKMAAKMKAKADKSAAKPGKKGKAGAI